jgi:predicted RNase H-like HicB family nuclease
MKVRGIIKAMESAGWRMEKLTATGHRRFSHPDRPDRDFKGDNEADGSAVVKYAVIFEQGPTSVGVTVPDLPGCFAVAPDLPAARKMIAEAIAFHIESLREDGLPVPGPALHAEDVNIAA